ncbi:hypothetical protein ACFLY0_01560 [Patescibacteria group bacterium]
MGNKKLKIVICGSMTAAKNMIEVKETLTESGHVVVLPDFAEEYAQMKTHDDMHTESAKNKIEHDLIRGYYNEIKESDAILIVNEKRHNIDNYIGGNSFLEMGFAFVLEKKIYLLNQIPEIGYRDEIEAMNPIMLEGDLNKI